MIWHTLRVCDVFVVDENLRDSELRNRSHTALLLLLHRAAEATGPIECIEETHNNIAANGFFDTLETGAAAKKLF